MEFTKEEVYRYARHIILPEVGGVGQEKLLKSKVLSIGAGGLGSPLLAYLAAAGVGKIGIVDFDKVEVSNLQRQIIHNVDNVGQYKADSAKEFINKLNPGVDVELFYERFNAKNGADIISEFDIVVDGTDNFPARYLINDLTVFQKKPNIHGSIFRFEGQVTVFDSKTGPCYRCLYPEPPPPGSTPSCHEAGVLGILPGIIGLLQAQEVIKIIIGIGQPLIGRLLLYDALATEFRKLKIQKDPDCLICSSNRTIHEPIDYEEFCQVRT
ncbi:MAG: molybdopterin-synthase adenylyltransferase MoeB [Nitrospinota bacterium]